MKSFIDIHSIFTFKASVQKKLSLFRNSLKTQQKRTLRNHWRNYRHTVEEQYPIGRTTANSERGNVENIDNFYN